MKLRIKDAAQKLKLMMQAKGIIPKGKMKDFIRLLVASGKKATALACLMVMISCASVDKKHGAAEDDSKTEGHEISEQDQKEMDKLIQKLLRKEEGAHCNHSQKDEEEFEKFIQELIRSSNTNVR